MLGSKILTVFLLYLGVGLGHHLYLELRFQGDRVLSFDQRDDAASNLARRHRAPDVETTLVDLTIAGRSCTGVPLRGSELLLTAAHCVVDDAYLVYGGGNITASYRNEDAWIDESLEGASVRVHPRYIETARAGEPSGFERMLRSAFTWSTIRGSDREASPYTWDVAVIRTPGRTWSFGVLGVTDDRSGPYLVETYQNFTVDGTPVCTLEIEENCPGVMVLSEAVEQRRYGVRCAVVEMQRSSQLDGWFPCALMPGGSGGAVIVTRNEEPYLLGLVTGGDEHGEGNGVTIDAVTEFVLSIAGASR
jgi:hypothetical protein